MCLEELRGGGRKDETDHQAGRHRERQADSEREARTEEDFGEYGRECDSEEGRVDMHGERLTLEAAVEPDADHNAPYVQKVLAEQREAEHEEQTRHRRARHLRADPVVDKAGT